MSIDPLFTTAARLFMGLFFLSAGLHKVKNKQHFQASMAAYQLAPDKLNVPMAFCLMITEPLIGVLLITDHLTLFAAVSAILITSLYLAAMAINLARGRTHVDCGCSFSRREAPLSGWHLLRNGALLGITALILLPETTRMLGVFDGIQITAAVLVSGLLYLSGDALLANRGYFSREET